jgi:uncharacterized protein (DUF427 family)
MRPKQVPPQKGQESVWDYPRPPRVERTDKRVVVTVNGVRIADSVRAKRVLETSHPPVYYIPREDIKMEYLRNAARTSYCEWKGKAVYFTADVNGRFIENIAWSYPAPNTAFTLIKDHLAFYASLADECLVDGERVKPQPGRFYGGWITAGVAGPFKGETGSEWW